MSSANLSPMSFRFDISEDSSRQRNAIPNQPVIAPKILNSFDLSSWNQFIPFSPSRTNPFKHDNTRNANEDQSPTFKTGFEPLALKNLNTSVKRHIGAVKNRVPVTFGRIGDTCITSLDPKSWNMSATRDTKLKPPKGLKWPLFLAFRPEKSHKDHVDLDLFINSTTASARFNSLFDENLTDSDLKTSIDGKDSESEEHLSVIKQNVLSLREDFNIILHELLGKNKSVANDNKGVTTDCNETGYTLGSIPIFDISNNTSISNYSTSNHLAHHSTSTLFTQQYQNRISRIRSSPKFGMNTQNDECPEFKLSDNQTPVRNDRVERAASPIRIRPFQSPNKQVSISAESESRRKNIKTRASTPIRQVSLAHSYQDMDNVNTPKGQLTAVSPKKPAQIHFQRHQSPDRLQSNSHKSPRIAESNGLPSNSYRLPRFGTSPESPAEDEIKNDQLNEESPLSDEHPIDADDNNYIDDPIDADDNYIDDPIDADDNYIDDPIDDIPPQNSSVQLSHRGDDLSRISKSTSNASDVTFHNSPLRRSNETQVVNDTMLENSIERVSGKTPENPIDVEAGQDFTEQTSIRNSSKVDQLYDEIDQIVAQSISSRLHGTPRIPISSRNSPAALYTHPPRLSRSPVRYANARTPTRAASVQTELATPRSIKSKSTKRKINYWTDAFHSYNKVPGAHDITSENKRTSSIDWEAENESLKRNNRYPQRLRIPRLQHWNADPADPIDMTVGNIMNYSFNYQAPSAKRQIKVSPGPQLVRGKATLHTSTKLRKRGRPRKYPIESSSGTAGSSGTLRQTKLQLKNSDLADRNYLKPGYVALLTSSGKKICYKAVYKNTDDSPDDIDGVKVYPIVMTSVCRTSLLIFPKDGHINFGESNEIFLCGYVSRGTNVLVQSALDGKQMDLNLKTNDTFCIPPNTFCHIYNKDTEEGAQLILIFINTA